MPRKVIEWQGKTPDTRIPPRVLLRVFERCGGTCHICFGKIMAGDKWHGDHIKRLKDGGENRESNLAPAHERCHSVKTANENKQQAVEDRKRKKHLGIATTKSRPMPGTKASGIRKRMNGTVEDW